MRTQAQATPQQSELANAAMNAVNMAASALDQAKQMLSAAGIDPTTVLSSTQATPSANRSRNSNSSAGRIPSPEQMEIRKLITEWAEKTPDIFTVKSMTDHLGKDRVQTRNAINALTESGLLIRWAEKLPEGRGAREIIYKPTAFNVGL